MSRSSSSSSWNCRSVWSGFFSRVSSWVKVKAAPPWARQSAAMAGWRGMSVLTANWKRLRCPAGLGEARSRVLPLTVSVTAHTAPVMGRSR